MKAIAFPGTQAEAVAWILDRDRQTRLKARSLYLDGWPWGEAITEACEKHCSVLWTVSQPASSARATQHVLDTSSVAQLGRDVDGDEPPHTPNKRSRAAAIQDLQPTPKKTKLSQQDSAGNQLCPDWNSGWCTKKQKDCPKKRKRLCSVVKPGGAACLSWSHQAKDCPHR